MLENFTLAAAVAEGVAVDALEPGTALVVETHNSRYGLIVLFEPCLVLVTGGTIFSNGVVARLEGATAGGTAVKTGWILVGFEIELCIGSQRARSSPVRSVTIETGQSGLPLASDPTLH